MEAANALPSAADGGDSIELLVDLMQGLLSREQEKFVGALQQKPLPKEAKDWEDWDTLYEPMEQIQSVFYQFAKDTPSKDQIDIEHVPAWLLKEYREALQTTLPNHPFLRGEEFSGPAFRDYVLAYLLHRSQSEAVERVLDQATFVPTPLFAHFYSTTAREGSGRHVGYLYEAITAQNALHSTSQVALVAPSDDTTHSLEISTPDFSADDAEENYNPILEIPVKVDDLNPVVFRHHLRHALLQIDGRLVLGESGQEFELEDVQAACKEIEIHASQIVARCYDRGHHVEIRADKYHQTSPTLDVRRRGEKGRFSVDWPGANRFPWAEFYSELVPQESTDQEDAMLALSQILLWFGRTKHQNFARARALIDNVAVGEHHLRKRLLAYLREQGIINPQGRLYLLDVDRAAQQGINWADLKKRDANEKLSRFLEQFLESVQN